MCVSVRMCVCGGGGGEIWKAKTVKKVVVGGIISGTCTNAVILYKAH